MLVVVIIGLLASTFAASEDVELLRKEFEAYKKVADERIKALEAELAETPPVTAPISEERISALEVEMANTQEATLTEEELEEIRSTLARAILDFEFHGYLRSGYGVDDSGDVMSVFKAPNSDAKYRLDNEAETYMETTFLTRAAPEDAGEDVSFETKITLAYVTPIADGADFDSTTSIREAYGLATGVVPGNPTTGFWAGQRFYSRHR